MQTISLKSTDFARRACEGEVLSITTDEMGRVVLYPFGETTPSSLVYLESGDEVSLDHIPAHLINLHRLDGVDLARVIDRDTLCFTDHPTCAGIPIRYFADWEIPVTLTVVHLSGHGPDPLQYEFGFISE